MAIVPMPKGKPKEPELPPIKPVFLAMAAAQMAQAEKDKGK